MHGIDQVVRHPAPVALPVLPSTSSLSSSASAAVIVDDSLIANLGEDDDLRQMSRATLAATLKVVAATLVDEQCSCVQEFVLCRQRMQRARRRLTDLQANSSGMGAAGAMDSGPSAAAPPSPPTPQVGSYRKHSTPTSFQVGASFDLGAEPSSSSPSLPTESCASATTAQVEALQAQVGRLQAQVEAQQAMLTTILGAVTGKSVA